MAITRLMQQAAAGNAAGEATYVEDVFSTYLYEGNGTYSPKTGTNTIVNGVDLDSEGGLVWVKSRGTSNSHFLYDTERGTSNFLSSNATSAENTSYSGYGVTSYNSNGFTLEGNVLGENGNGDDLASWTFRKAPKFFDVVTYSYQGNASGTTAQISHNLGTTPGFIIIKAIDKSENAVCWHKDINGYLKMGTQGTSALFTFTGPFGSTTPDMTDSYFTVGYDGATNSPNYNYVAYLFAHNDGDGGFGENADQDIIKCGSYSGSNQTIDLGFEPQFIIVKRTDSAENWMMFDSMRGWNADGDSLGWLMPNATNPESTLTNGQFELRSNGFFTGSGYTPLNGGSNYIYIAIRRGPMKTPESGTEVFAVDTYTGNGTNGRLISSGFPVDSAIIDPRNGYSTPGGPNWFSRLTGNGKFLTTAATTVERDGSSNSNGVLGQDGITVSTTGTNVWSNVSSNTYVSWFLRRAPGFFDVVAYEGNGTAGRTVSHNLGVAPELTIVKRRDGVTNWVVNASGLGTGPDSGGLTTGFYLRLNSTNAAAADNGSFFGNNNGSGYQAPTDSSLIFGGHGDVNTSGADYIAYLFATLPGISKVGSYTGDGTADASKIIDCGFSSGARFVLIKRTDSTSNWNLFDTERGIVADPTAGDPRLELNTTDSEDTGDDAMDPDSSGFAVRHRGVNDDDVNVNGGTYIFLAIA